MSFVLESGVDRVFPHLFDLLQRGGRLRFLTGDYLGITEPDALLRLLDLEGNIEFRVFETGTAQEPVAALPIPARSFHPKAYIFRHANDGIAFVGSSNLSASALTTSVEWNYRIISSRDRAGFIETLAAFDSLFRHECTKPLTVDWVTEYRNGDRFTNRSLKRQHPDRGAKAAVFPTSQEEALKPRIRERLEIALGSSSWRPVSGKTVCQRSTQVGRIQQSCS